MTTELPESIKAQIAKAQEFQKIASSLHKLIEDNGIEIEDLVVAFSNGTASLHGKAKSESDKESAEKVVRQSDQVKNVSNGIVVGP